MKEGTSTDQIKPRHNGQHVQGAVRPSTHTCPGSRRSSGPHREMVFVPTSSAADPRTAARLTSARRPLLGRRMPMLNCSRRLHEDLLLWDNFAWINHKRAGAIVETLLFDSHSHRKSSVVTNLARSEGEIRHSQVYYKCEHFTPPCPRVASDQAVWLDTGNWQEPIFTVQRIFKLCTYYVQIKQHLSEGKKKLIHIWAFVQMYSIHIQALTALQ